MNGFIRTFFTLVFIVTSVSSLHASPKPIVQIETNMGDIIVELDHQRAPTTVMNFLYYTKKGFYNGTIFHRVITDFMIQGGGFNANYRQKSTRSPIKNESTNGLENTVGTIAMARTEDVDSATSQFYINVGDNRSLNATYGEPGYTVFGKVIEGIDIVYNIANVPVQPMVGVSQNVPVNPVIIKSMSIVDTKKIKKEKEKLNVKLESQSMPDSMSELTSDMKAEIIKKPMPESKPD